MGHDPRPSILSWLGNLPMKRFLFRISALAMMLVLGLVAIVYAQRSNGDGESNSDPRTPRLFLGADAQPNPLRTADARPMPKTVQSTAVRQASHDATTATEKTPMVAAASPSSPPALPADPFGLQTSPPPGVSSPRQRRRVRSENDSRRAGHARAGWPRAAIERNPSFAAARRAGDRADAKPGSAQREPSHCRAASAGGRSSHLRAAAIQPGQ